MKCEMALEDLLWSMLSAYNQQLLKTREAKKILQKFPLPREHAHKEDQGDPEDGGGEIMNFFNCQPLRHDNNSLSIGVHDGFSILTTSRDSILSFLPFFEI